MDTILRFPRGVQFIRDHRLWEGFFSYGWLSRIFIVIAVLIGLKFMTIFFSWVGSVSLDSPVAVVSNMGVLFKDFAIEGFGFLFAGGMKYVMLVLLEVLVFHFSRRTLAILINKESDTEFDAFLKAQIRMVKIAFRSWILEMIASLLIKIFFSIFGFIDFLEPALILGVQCYYLGFAILDNYFEQFDMSIKESAKYAQNYIGVALALGLVVYVLLLIPVLGTIAAPIIAAVTGSLIMYQLSDLHLLGKETELELDDLV
ncbi:MAG: hypothetical protein DHS20C18_35000 [Saprospiraceae bacterium]|nr:MAG: hypothetical protein DHS20C18_35000 [Saprospiraceae bacterium]